MKKVISISEMAEYCQVTTETIRRWIDSGAIPSSRTLGGHRRIEFKDFVKFLEEHKLPLHDYLIGKKKYVLLVGFSEDDLKSLSSELVAVDKNIIVEDAGNVFEAGHKMGILAPKMVVFSGKAQGLDLTKTCHHIRGTTESKLTKMAVLFGGEIGADLQKIGVTWMPSLDRKILTDLIES